MPNTPYLSVCNKCRIKTWYEGEQPCHIGGCTGTLISFDYSDLDQRFTPYYESQKRVEVEWKEGFEDYTGYGSRTEGKKARFYVGKSTGWKPVYLMILKRNSSGGAAILSSAVKSIRAI